VLLKRLLELEEKEYYPEKAIYTPDVIHNKRRFQIIIIIIKTQSPRLFQL
jgi:hypothetical protein